MWLYREGCAILQGLLEAKPHGKGGDGGAGQTLTEYRLGISLPALNWEVDVKDKKAQLADMEDVAELADEEEVE